MHTILTVPTILATPPLATESSGLAAANALILAVFLALLGLALLWAINFYRRKDLIENLKNRKKSWTSSKGSDLVSQLPHMTREELRQMVAHEIKTNSEKEPEKSPVKIEPPDDPVVRLLLNLNPDVATSDKEPVVSKPAVSVKAEEIKPEPQALEAPVPTEPVEPKPPFHDRVERSMLSNELPEEFRRKSRKI
jgi:hypothetical protein